MGHILYEYNDQKLCVDKCPDGFTQQNVTTNYQQDFPKCEKCKGELANVWFCTVLYC